MNATNVSMAEYLSNTGFDLIFEGNKNVVVKDPRHGVYLVYSAGETNLDWITAERAEFESVMAMDDKNIFV